MNDPKHPIHLRILNKNLCEQYLNQRRLIDWSDSNELNQLNLIQSKDYDQINPTVFNYSNRALKQLQQIQTTNSSLDDQEPLHQSTMASGNLQTNISSTNFQQNYQTSLPSTIQKRSSQKSNQQSNRTNNQHCKLPSAVWHQLSAGNNKCCYNVAFSNDGSKIACCASVFTAYMSTEKRSSIFIYDIPGK